MVRIGCEVDPQQSFRDGLLASAYRGADGKVVVVFVNLSKQELHCDVGSANEIDVYTTSSNSNLERSRQAGSAIAVPGRSVSTCLWGAR